MLFKRLVTSKTLFLIRSLLFIQSGRISNVFVDFSDLLNAKKNSLINLNYSKFLSLGKDLCFYFFILLESLKGSLFLRVFDFRKNVFFISKIEWCKLSSSEIFCRPQP